MMMVHNCSSNAFVQYLCNFHTLYGKFHHSTLRVSPEGSESSGSCSSTIHHGTIYRCIHRLPPSPYLLISYCNCFERLAVKMPRVHTNQCCIAICLDCLPNKSLHDYSQSGPYSRMRDLLATFTINLF